MSEVQKVEFGTGLKILAGLMILFALYLLYTCVKFNATYTPKNQTLGEMEVDREIARRKALGLPISPND